MREALLTFFESQLEPALEMLRRMVAINSYTLNRTGVNEVAKLTAECFAQLGFEAEYIPSMCARYGDHLVLTRRGRSTRAIELISHLDTVFTSEEEVQNHFAWRREGDRIYGPGTMDIKGGTIMAHLVLSGIYHVAPETFDNTTWIVLLNSSEEVLSTDFGQICLERIGPDPLAALVFEAGGKHGADAALVTGRKGRATFRVETEGRGAHAGSRHQRGANAISQMADIIQNIAGFTNYKEGLTFNVGTLSGGTVVNRVPHQAAAEVEMRAFTQEVYQVGKKRILGLNGLSTVASAEGGHRCRTRVEVTAETPPWPANPNTDRLYELWEKAAVHAGLRLTREQRGGVSDANYIWRSIPTLDGLGPYGDNAHCSEQTADGTKEQEYVDVSSFVPRAALHVLGALNLIQS